MGNYFMEDVVAIFMLKNSKNYFFWGRLVDFILNLLFSPSKHTGTQSLVGLTFTGFYISIRAMY